MNRYETPVRGNARRLMRDLDQAVLGGVCAGLARHFDLDALFVRLATVIAGLMMPKLVVIAYVVAWLVLDSRPVDGARYDTPHFDRRS